MLGNWLNKVEDYYSSSQYVLVVVILLWRLWLFPEGKSRVTPVTLISRDIIKAEEEAREPTQTPHCKVWASESNYRPSCCEVAKSAHFNTFLWDFQLHLVAASHPGHNLYSLFKRVGPFSEALSPAWPWEPQSILLAASQRGTRSHLSSYITASWRRPNRPPPPPNRCPPWLGSGR